MGERLAEAEATLEKAKLEFGKTIPETARLAGIALVSSLGNYGAATGAAYAAASAATAGAFAAVALACATYYVVSRDVRMHELKQAQEETNHADQELKNCIDRVEKAEECLRNATTSAEKWESIEKAADAIAKQMGSLQQHVTRTMRYFTTLNKDIRKFSEIYRTGAGDQDSSVVPNLDDLGLDKIALELKCSAHVVHAVSAMYARVSGEHIQEGFGLIASLSYLEGDEEELSEVELAKRREGKLRLYQDGAEAGIQCIVYEEKLKLFREAQILYPALTDASPLRPKLEM
ncbi:hypothetical protein TWF718_010148 [Orbilia javanica]|uniref:Uncharacterized protein n=1 Tax=Orbilia javanica TaxID=47235 RepID=A0AAN8MJ89_9PEZI